MCGQGYDELRYIADDRMDIGDVQPKCSSTEYNEYVLERNQGLEKQSMIMRGQIFGLL